MKHKTYNFKPKKKKKVKSNNTFKVPRRPKSLNCYICGRAYGTRSLGIHLKTCKKKWLIQEGKKLKKSQRRPYPNTPRGLHELLAKNNITWKDIDAYNTGSYYSFKQEALIKCQFCNRSFLEERMKGHFKICTKEKPFNYLDDQNIKVTVGAGLQMYKQAQDNAPVKMNLVPCKICGRKFNEDRIQKHQTICLKNLKEQEKRKRRKKTKEKLAKKSGKNKFYFQ